LSITLKSLIANQRSSRLMEAGRVTDSKCTCAWIRFVVLFASLYLVAQTVLPPYFAESRLGSSTIQETMSMVVTIFFLWAVFVRVSLVPLVAFLPILSIESVLRHSR
jgi:hypothetical protein